MLIVTKTLLLINMTPNRSRRDEVMSKELKKLYNMELKTMCPLPNIIGLNEENKTIASVQENTKRRGRANGKLPLNHINLGEIG